VVQIFAFYRIFLLNTLLITFGLVAREVFVHRVEEFILAIISIDLIETWIGA
jgi:hypothetical protein